MKTIPFEELTPEQKAKWGAAVERLRGNGGNGSTLPPPVQAAPSAPATSTRPFRPYFIAELGETVHVTYADLNDGLFIAEHTPKQDPGSINGYILQIIRCVYKEPGVRRFRMDSLQDDRPFLRETLSFETLVDLVSISSALGRRQEYVTEGVKSFLSATQTFFAALSGHSNTCTDYPMELKEQQKALMSVAFSLTSAIPSTSGTASDAAE